MLIAFIIWTIVSIIFLVIGIICRKSKDPVGFFTFTEPPLVEDVKSYNNAVSILWFVVAGVLEIIGVPILFLEQNSPIFILIMLMVVILMIAMMITYIKIESKYKKQ